MVKRETWTEDDLNELSSEEPDVFERKAGKLFENEDKFLDAVAKGVSAFANSGGGSLILGVTNDGAPDGLPSRVGRATMRDWIEQKTPHLVDYPLADFRVHTVIRSEASKIPHDREVIVIDVGDSAAAPHQSKRDKVYYRREGGRSVPAPHFYLELLRQRLTNPNLEFKLIKVEPIDAYECDEGLFLRVQLKFHVQNVGRVAAYHWRLNFRSVQANDIDVASFEKADYRFYNFPPKKLGGLTPGGIPIGDRTILPGCGFNENIDFGCRLFPTERTIDAVQKEAELMLASIALNTQIATENSPGEAVAIFLAPVLDIDAMIGKIKEKCLDYFHI
jgi:hypothetical protein